MRLIVLVLAAAALPPGHPSLVTSLLERVDMECWLGSCSDMALKCAETDPVCKSRLGCEQPQTATTGAVEHCYHGLSFAQLQPSERQLFGCAAAHGCVPGPAASFLQEPDKETGVDMNQFLLALEKLEGERLRRTTVEALSEAGAKTKIAKAAEQLELLHERALPARSSLEELDKLDENLSSVQAELDAHELRSRTALSTPPLGMVLAALTTEQGQREEASSVTPEAPYSAKAAAAEAAVKGASVAAADAEYAVTSLDAPKAGPAKTEAEQEAPVAEAKAEDTDPVEAPRAVGKKPVDKQPVHETDAGVALTADDKKPVEAKNTEVAKKVDEKPVEAKKAEVSPKAGDEKPVEAKKAEVSPKAGDEKPVEAKKAEVSPKVDDKQPVEAKEPDAQKAADAVGTPPSAPTSLLEEGARPGSARDLETTRLGSHETLAHFIRGLGGDTASLERLAEHQRAEDARPLAGELSREFQDRYLEESARLGRPASRAAAAAAEHAASSLVQGRGVSPGAAAIEATMEKLSAFSAKLKTDFHQVGTALDAPNLRNEDA